RTYGSNRRGRDRPPPTTSTAPPLPDGAAVRWRAIRDGLHTAGSPADLQATGASLSALSQSTYGLSNQLGGSAIPLRECWWNVQAQCKHHGKMDEHRHERGRVWQRACTGIAKHHRLDPAENCGEGYTQSDQQEGRRPWGAPHRGGKHQKFAGKNPKRR